MCPKQRKEKEQGNKESGCAQIGEKEGERSHRTSLCSRRTKKKRKSQIAHPPSQIVHNSVKKLPPIYDIIFPKPIKKGD
jgi:hypothetical protein